MPVERGEGLRAILAGSSNLPLSASNKAQKPLPPGMGFDWKPSDRQTQRDIIQADYRDEVIRRAVKEVNRPPRKPQEATKEEGIGVSIGRGLRKLLEAVIPDAGAAEPNKVQKALGMKEAPTGVSMNTQVQLNRLEEELNPKEKPKPPVKDGSKTQAQEFEDVMGKDAAARRKKKQEEDRQRLMNKR